MTHDFSEMVPARMTPGNDPAHGSEAAPYSRPVGQSAGSLESRGGKNVRVRPGPFLLRWLDIVSISLCAHAVTRFLGHRDACKAFFPSIKEIKR